IKKACPSPAPTRRPACSIQPCRRTHLFLKIEVSSLRLLPRCAFALRLRLNLPWRLLLRRSSPPLAEGAPAVKADAGAPAERHLIDPTHSRAPVAGALPAAIGANALGKGLICPASYGAEAAWAAADMAILAP